MQGDVSPWKHQQLDKLGHSLSRCKAGHGDIAVPATSSHFNIEDYRHMSNVNNLFSSPKACATQPL